MLLTAGAAGAGIAVALLLGGQAGIGFGAAAAVATFLVLRRLEPASARVLRLQATSDLPLAADLLSATLRAGAPVDRAANAVADALGGPLAVHLVRVARSLRLGAPAEEAWAYLSPVPGAERLVAAAIRSSASGAALAGALTRLADDLRADRSIAAQVAAHRAGVLVVLPLGLCFLPAFILAGLAPVIIAVLSDLL
ncbi:type II secretion system F family protein [Catenuloplanes nepalensis]|uniref:type II secretion system F family protein n=1 Tax=Catenuloplanes nepalensis TaxID=587533 RepID=UPI0027D794F7|nr:type II secretion system F family protein [Catenuloplanes nepalensis]